MGTRMQQVEVVINVQQLYNAVQVATQRMILELVRLFWISPEKKKQG